MDKNAVASELREGQNVRVFQKFVDGKRERNVPFVGKLLKVRGIGINKTITVRQNLEGIDVEKIIPIALPTITSIEIIVEEKKKQTKKTIGAKSQKSKKPKTSKAKKAAAAK